MLLPVIKPPSQAFFSGLVRGEFSAEESDCSKRFLSEDILELLEGTDGLVPIGGFDPVSGLGLAPVARGFVGGASGSFFGWPTFFSSDGFFGRADSASDSRAAQHERALLYCTCTLPDLVTELLLNWLRALAIDAMRLPPLGGPGLGAGLLTGPGDEPCL